MTQEEKDLLLKDLCARLPYGVKVSAKYVDEIDAKEGKGRLSLIDSDLVIAFVDEIENNNSFTYVALHEVKPYLFPLLSMTEKQRKEYEDALTYHDYVKGGWTIAKSFDDEYIIPYWFVDFCNKNHFDYRGLIEKGLAIDATGLNIYN